MLRKGNVGQPYLMVGILIAYIAAWVIQGKLFLNWDVSWLLRGAALSLQGGTFTHDFFSPNPLATLYFYRIPIFFSEWLRLNLVLTFQIYIFSIATVSLFLCAQLFNKLRQPQDGINKNILLMTLAITFLIFPFYELGQRDCLLYVVAMPYLLLVACRLQAIPINHYYAMLIGLFAGLVLAMKPQFLVLPFIVELYCLIRKRNLFFWARAEIGVIACVFGAYLVITAIYYPDYFLVLMPIVWKNYTASIGLPWRMILFSPVTLFGILPLVLYIAEYKENRHQVLLTVLVLSQVGYLLTYAMQRNFFSHHLLPCLEMGLLILVLQLAGLMLAKQNWRKKIVFMLVATSYIFLFLYFFHDAIHFIYTIFWTSMIFDPSAFFIFMALVFAAVLGQAQQNFVKTLFSVALIIYVGFLTFSLTLRSAWHEHFLIVTLISLFVMLTVLLPRNKNVLNYYLTTLLAMIFLSYPLGTFYISYNKGITYRNYALNKLITFFAAHPQYKSIDVISTQGLIANPLVHYINLVGTSRFDCLWLVSGLVKRLNERGEQATRQFIKNDNNKYALVTMVAEDLESHKPDLVMVDTTTSNVMISDAHYYFDYISYFSENKRFKEEWRHYRYLQTISIGSPIKPIQLNLYERSS